MMKCRSCSLLLFLLILAVCAGCATTLPPSYEIDTDGRVLDGNVLALAGDGGIVAAATSDGLFLKKNGGPWEKLETPGIRNPGRVTCLGVNGEEIAVGTDGEGLHLFSGSTWEVRTSRYGGLADDGVLSLAYDGSDEGLEGSTLWIGTRKGITARHGDDWKVYTPGKDWLVSMTGKSSTAAGKVYVGSGFKLGERGGDSDTFRPPVTAIGVGSSSLVLGNSNSRIAMVAGDTVAAILLRDDVSTLRDDISVRNLIVKEPVIWVGTNTGLIWGGLRGSNLGKPWPTNHGYLTWSGVLYGSRDSRPFEYRWKLLGYNTAVVTDQVSNGSNLWVAYRAEKGVRTFQSKLRDKQNDVVVVDEENQTSGVRLFPSLDDYILRREVPVFENYSLNAGIKGNPSALYVSPDSSTVWVGTDKGLWELKAY